MLRTGSDYIQAVKSAARNVYIGGEKVDDVTTHPAFANVIRTVARLYDVTSDPDNQDRLTFVCPDNGQRYNNIWLRPRSRDDLERRNNVHRAWAEVSGGLLGRSGDHVAGWITGMACCPEKVDLHNEGYAERIMKYYRYARDKDLFVAYAIVPPAGVKSANSVETGKSAALPANKWGSAAGLQVVGERREGLVVSGFKVLATGAILADEILFGNFQSLAEGQEKFAATFALPVGTPGMTLISRRPFAQMAASELDDPLAFRYDETDAIVHCDDVVVPWERVFTHNRVDTARAAFSETPAHPLGNVQAHVRLLVKLRLTLGVMKQVADANGILTAQPVRDTLAGLAMEVAMLEGLIEAENAKPSVWENGYVAQNLQAMYATMAWTTRNFPDFMKVCRQLLGSHPFQQPADISVFDNEITTRLYEIFTLHDRKQAIERYKLMRLAWDLVGTEFASRHTQYEMFYNGAPHVAMIRMWHFFDWEPVDSLAEKMLQSIGTYDDVVGKSAKPTITAMKTS